MILQIRGANGSGKTTLVRHFIVPHAKPVDLATYHTPKGSPRFVEGSVSEFEDLGSVAVVGSYRNACGGMDTVPSFELSRQAIRRAAGLADHVLCEGVLASTVSGSWIAFAYGGVEPDRPLSNHTARQPMAFAYLQTPEEECLRRVRERNGGKPFKEDQVRKKVVAIRMTRTRMLDARLPVYDLPLESPEAAVCAILQGTGEDFRAQG